MYIDICNLSCRLPCDTFSFTDAYPPPQYPEPCPQPQQVQYPNDAGLQAPQPYSTQYVNPPVLDPLPYSTQQYQPPPPTYDTQKGITQPQPAQVCKIQPQK